MKISSDTRDGLVVERANPEWPFPYAPQPEYALPALWRGIVLTDGEWAALVATTPGPMRVWEPSIDTSWPDAARYWCDRAPTQAAVMRIMDSQLVHGEAAAYAAEVEEAGGELRDEVGRCNRAEFGIGRTVYLPRFDSADARPILMRLVARMLAKANEV